MWGADVVADVRGRLPFYRKDWSDGLVRGIVSPCLYCFFASVLPALAFGQQLALYTRGALTVVQVLAATAISGVVQARARRRRGRPDLLSASIGSPGLDLKPSFTPPHRRRRRRRRPQSLLGGQPLLIVGVAEPIVIIYGFLFALAEEGGLGAGLFLPWAARRLARSASSQSSPRHPRATTTKSSAPAAAAS